MIDTYRTRAIKAQAVQFTGANLADLRKLVPPEAATFDRVAHESIVIMSAPGRRNRMISEGDWVSWNGVTATAHSHQSFTMMWERVSE